MHTSGCQNEMVEGLHIEYYVEKLACLASQTAAAASACLMYFWLLGFKKRTGLDISEPVAKF